MGLLIGLILFALIWISSMPASSCLRDGKEHYWKCRQKDREYWYSEAQKHDCYYEPKTGSMNEDFYSDGSVKRDASTGYYYEKGEYYCRADGVNASYQMTDPRVPRPPKK